MDVEDTGVESALLRRAGDPASVPDVENIRAVCTTVFGHRPCRWQVEFAQAMLRHDSDVILHVGTGMGKTLAFWLPLLFRPQGILIVVTALNVLGDQNVASLASAGIPAISINRETATSVNFQVNSDIT